MDPQIKITLPANTAIGACAFANAANTQQVTVMIDGKTVATVSGAGTQNKLLGHTVFNSGSGNCAVAITSNGVPSSAVSTKVVLGNRLNVVVIGSEDSSDKDYNDTICYLNWPIG
jgi:hypothetical protein